MTIITEPGYSWTDGKHARILHSGLWRKIRVANPASSLSGPSSEAEKLVSSLTYDRWSPFTNYFASTGADKDFTQGSWNQDEGSLGPDDQTFTENSASGIHQLRHTDVTVDDNEKILAVRFSVPPFSQIPDIFVLQFSDGADLYRATYEFGNDTFLINSNVAAGKIRKQTNGQWLMYMRFLPAATSAGVVNLRFQVGGSESYAGNGERRLRVHEVVLHGSTARINFESFYSDDDVDCVGIAGHNLGSTGAELQWEYDNGSPATKFSYTEITSDEPVMGFFTPESTLRWSIAVRGGVLPEIGMVRFGKALKMEQPFYAGFAPSLGAEEPVLQGNITEGGDWLGRNVIRRGKTAEYQWDLLTTDWVESNLYGRNGLIRAVQDDPFWVAWRPSENDQVDFAWTVSPPSPPSKMGVKDRMEFSLSAQVLGVDYVE